MIQIQWLDLSFNHLQRLDENIVTYFPNLTTLYLHANQLPKLSHLKKLAGLSQLKSLTLYGNPLEENKHYRNYVLYLFPELKQLDFSVITDGQREQVDHLTHHSLTPPADAELESSL
jgi:Leucine-rich repeat (LRR) protein